MSIGYVDTSFIISILLEEASYKKNLNKFYSIDQIFVTNLLESEALSTLKRNKITKFDKNLFERVDWISIPERLTEFLAKIFSIGYLRGADAHHLASALWIVGAENTSECHFLTLDENQKAVAKKLGFKV